MSNSLLQKSFKSLTCSEEGHENQPLRSICISQQCEHTSVMCDLCSLEKHIDHDRITLKTFFKQLLSIEFKSENAIPLCAGVDQVFQKIGRKLHQVENNFTNPELVFKTFEQWQKLNIKYALDFYKLSEKVSELLVQSEDHQKVQKLNSFIKTCYFKYFGKLQQQDWNKSNIGESLLNKKIDELTNTLQHLQKLHTTHKLTDYQALNLFPLSIQQPHKLKVYFSQQLKPSNMTLISSTQAKMQKAGSQRLMILQPCLSKSMSIKKWGVRIIKLASWIGVGVCHINEIKKANFMFNYTNTGHGNYLISSNGYSWSSYKKQYNSKFEPFTFTTGDIIHLEYNPKDRIIKFKKQSDANQPTYQLEVQANDDPVHPEINLTGLNDQVELINF